MNRCINKTPDLGFVNYVKYIAILMYFRQVVIYMFVYLLNKHKCIHIMEIQKI